jgi:hypothetical protein
MSETLNKVYRLIANDSYACSFQTMGQYRTALLKEIRQIKAEERDPCGELLKEHRKRNPPE